MLETPAAGCSARSVRGADAEAAADEQQHQLGQHDAADEQTDGRVLDEAGFQLGEIDVQHHDDEQEQHGHRADVDDDEDHRQELGAQQHEEPGRVEEGEDQDTAPRARGSCATITMTAATTASTANR